MDLLPAFRLGLLNGWWFILPMVLPMAYVATARKDVAARLADMTGYTSRERF